MAPKDEFESSLKDFKKEYPEQGDYVTAMRLAINGFQEKLDVKDPFYALKLVILQDIMDEEYDDARQYLKSLATKITEEKNSLPDQLDTI